MFPRSFGIQGFTREDRTLVIAEAQEALAKSGAWVIDFKLFSNKTINIVFEIPARRTADLRGALAATGIRLFEESEKVFEEITAHEIDADGDTELRGTLRVVFIHNQPDLRIEVPAFE